METITPEQQYRIKLIESIQYLMKSADETFTELINLAMVGEFSEIDTEFEEGESVKFNNRLLPKLQRSECAGSNKAA